MIFTYFSFVFLFLKLHPISKFVTANHPVKILEKILSSTHKEEYFSVKQFSLKIAFHICEPLYPVYPSGFFNKFIYVPSFGSISSFNNHCFESKLYFSTYLVNGSSICVTIFSSISFGCFHTLGTSLLEHSHI